MSGKKDQEKLQAERHQLVIQELLRDEDNKYCVDCDAKGPRWASWNIGVFLCIRCAGIHRNLGVHISKVKSVNLDAWTLPQLAMMREMGNSRARAIYEAKLPDNFRRPQTDSALETFIRSKYEQKRYIAPNYVPIKPDVEGLAKEIQRLEQSTKKRHTPNVVTLPHGHAQSVSEKRPSSKNASSTSESSSSQKPIDLLGLDSPTSGPGLSSGDNFTPFTSGFSLHDPGDPNAVSRQPQPPPPPAGSSATIKQTVKPSTNDSPPSTGAGTSSAALDLFGLNFGEPCSVDPAGSSDPTSMGAHSDTPATTTGKCTKESILALYQQCTPNSTGLFQSSTAGPPIPAAYGQYSGPVPPSNWAFGGATTTSADPWASSSRGPVFSDAQPRQQQQQQQPQPLAPSFQPFGNFGSPNTGVMPFTLQNEAQAKAPVSFQLPVTNAPSNIPVWSDAYDKWPSSNSNPPASLFGSLGAPGSANDQNPVPSWSLTSQQPTNFGSAGSVGAPNFFTPTAMNTTAAAHQAYLSQVQSQLASLQLGTTVNQQQ